MQNKDIAHHLYLFYNAFKEKCSKKELVMKKGIVFFIILLLTAQIAATENNTNKGWLTNESLEEMQHISKILNQTGLNLYRKREFNASLANFLNAVKANPNHYWAMFNSACLFSVLRNKTQALIYFEKSIPLWKGHRSRPYLDSDFDSIRDTPEFKKLIIKMDDTARKFRGQRS